MNKPIRLAITTGDSDGIGLEVTCKALNELGPQKNVQFYLFRSNENSEFLKMLDKKFQRKPFSALRDVPRDRFESKTIVDIASSDSPAKWVFDAATACHKNSLDALTTAPLSKTEIQRAGFKEIGHTEILKTVTGVKTALMSFVGTKFNVVLATSHVALKKLAIEKQNILEAGRAAIELKKLLPKSYQKRPIAVLCLNPHAGENGLLGDEEALHILPAITELSKLDDFIGPLVPDAAFLPNNWKKYSVYICAYHDQGLIPFKAFHGHGAGVHITLGIPFIRTSVDHGTAKDIFGRNKADASSMKNAIELAVKLARRKGK